MTVARTNAAPWVSILKWAQQSRAVLTVVTHLLAKVAKRYPIDRVITMTLPGMITSRLAWCAL
jgi:hypothetical protein